MKLHQLLTGALVLGTITGLISAYPNKVTITNTSAEEITAHAKLVQATPEGSEVSQMVPAHGTATFEGKIYTRIRVVGSVPVRSGSVCQGTACIESVGYVGDSFAFDKDFKGEITLKFDVNALHKLTLIKRQ